MRTRSCQAGSARPSGNPLDALLPVLELQYLDETGRKGATTVKYPLGTTVAFLDAQATALASLIAPITGCVLIRQRIIYKAVATPRDVPDVGSTVKSQGVFIFSTSEDGSTPLEVIGVPGIEEEVISNAEPGNGVSIDVTNSDVIAFLDTVLTGVYSNPFGNDITSLAAAYRQSRS